MLVYELDFMKYGVFSLLIKVLDNFFFYGIFYGFGKFN